MAGVERIIHAVQHGCQEGASHMVKGVGVSWDGNMVGGGVWHLYRVFGVQRVVLVCVLLAVSQHSMMERWICGEWW